MSGFVVSKMRALTGLLLLIWRFPHCCAFAPLADVKAAKKQTVRRSASGQNDPYELQYRQYCQPQAGGASTTLDEPVNGGSDSLQSSIESEVVMEPIIETTAQAPYTYSYLSMGSSSDSAVAESQSTYDATTNTDAAATNGYTYSYLQQPIDAEVVSDARSSQPQYATTEVSAPADPYEAQLRQYAEATSYSILDGPETTSLENNAKVANSPADDAYSPAPTKETALVHSSAQQLPPEPEMTPEELEELENKYLQMVSNEISYKKLIGQNPYALTDIPVDVIISRVLDGLEDEQIAKKNKNARPEDMSPDRPTVVVLGSGWGAHAFVKLASSLDMRVIVVSPVNHFVFTPMLASAAVGTVEYRSMTEPIRVTNPNLDNYIEGRAVGIDVENRRVTVRLTSEGISTTGKIQGYSDDSSNFIEIPYDRLICAVGTKVRSTIVPGAHEHCFPLKTAQDSKVLRTAVQEALENACRADVEGWGELTDEKRWRRVAFVIIGGGPTGVEFAGELNDFLLDICQPRRGPYARLMNDFSITLIHGGEDLLPQFDKGLRQRALQALQDRGVDVRLNTRVQEVDKKYVILQRKGSNEPELIPAGVTVWAAGNEPVPFVQDLLSQLPESAVGSAGRIKVDKWLRCPTHTSESFGSIFVIGDAADLPSKESDPNSSLPQTAQVAGQQGAFMARLFNRGYDLSQTPPQLPKFDELSAFRIWLLLRGLEEAPDFVFLNLGLLAYVGGGEALTQVQAGDVPIAALAGKRAFALWRSVYLAKQASMRNQSQLIFDWAKSQSYGRDLTRL